MWRLLSRSHHRLNKREVKDYRTFRSTLSESSVEYEREKIKEIRWSAYTTIIRWTFKWSPLIKPENQVYCSIFMRFPTFFFSCEMLFFRTYNFLTIKIYSIQFQALDAYFGGLCISLCNFYSLACYYSMSDEKCLFVFGLEKKKRRKKLAGMRNNIREFLVEYLQSAACFTREMSFDETNFG